MSELNPTDSTEKDGTEFDLTPVSIDRDGEGAILIRWADQRSIRWTAAQLRKACPCATCREKKRGDQTKGDATSPAMPSLPVLSAAEARPMRIESMQPVGSYAYNIAFSDGHASGIFPFRLLYDGAPE